MDGWVEKIRARLAAAARAVKRWMVAAWHWVARKPSQAGRFVYNHAIGVFLVAWGLASAGAVVGIMYLADPCRGTNLVCPDVEWIRPGYLAEDFRNLLWAASLVFGGAGAGAALINALRRTRLMQAEHALAQRGQDAETFSRAVNQLGSKERAVRLGAIYTLEGLMRSAFAEGGDKAFGRQIGETLAAFVREQSVGLDKAVEMGELIDGDDHLRLVIDREAAVSVLARSWPFDHRPALDGEGGIDLSGAQLAWHKLPNGADLREFDLGRANLEGVKFDFADLSKANLADADLTNAWLEETDLQGSELAHATFVFAQLQRARMRAATCVNANFRFALLGNADLREAILVGADLQEASFESANLQGAMLYGSNMEDASFRLADISGAHFVSPGGGDSTRKLTAELIASARWQKGDPPVLPDDMELPHRGDGKPLDDASPFDESWMKDVGPNGIS